MICLDMDMDILINFRLYLVIKKIINFAFIDVIVLGKLD